jgi:hypothetical protein
MAQDYPRCPYCENGTLVPSSDFSVPWICTLCGSNMTRRRDLYGPAEPAWFTRDGRELQFLADPDPSAIVVPEVAPPPPSPEPAAPPAAKPAKTKPEAGKHKA